MVDGATHLPAVVSCSCNSQAVTTHIELTLSDYLNILQIQICESA